MRNEDIDYLIRKGIPVTEYNIKNINQSEINKITTDLIINKDSLSLTKDTINNIYNYIAGIYNDTITEKIELRKKIESLMNKIEQDGIDIDQGISTLKEEVYTSMVLEQAMSGEIKTTLIKFNTSEILSNESENILLINDMIIADSSNYSSNKSVIKLEKYSFSNLTAFSRTRDSLFEAKIELISDSGIGYFPPPEKEVINNDISFRIEDNNDIYLSRNIDLLIDKKDSSTYNQIELKLKKAHIVSVYTSQDNKTFTKRTDKPRYIKDSIIQLGIISDRFIKIIFHKKKRDNVANGKNNYSIEIESLSILKTTFTGTSVMITNPIEIDGAYSKVAISVCDCNTEKDSANINYSLSINGNDWEPVRPIGQSNNSQLRNTVNTNIMIQNKFILLEDKEEENYSLKLPTDFTSSNFTRVFANNITKSHEDWIRERGMYYSIGILYEEKEIDFGNKEILLNGKWYSGIVTLKADIYKIGILDENYANIILERDNVVDLNNGEYSITTSENKVITVYDPLYPYNHKYIIEKDFDYIFQKEIYLEKDFNIHRSQDGKGSTISTISSYENLIIAYRLHKTDVNSIQIKAEMTNNELHLIPYIEKIILRLA